MSSLMRRAPWRGAFFCGSLSVVLLLTPLTASADDDWIDNPQPQSVLPSGAGGAETSSFVSQPSVSAAQAASRVRQLHGGRVLSVSPARRGDSLGYRVRVLVDGGRVKTVYVRSGQASAPSGSDRSEFRTIGDG